MGNNATVTVGSGNVFADLGLPDAEELQLKSLLRIEIRITPQEADPADARTLLAA